MGGGGGRRERGRRSRRKEGVEDVLFPLPSETTGGREGASTLE